MAKVIHLSSVHPAIDNRIFFKECMSLAKAGHSVSLIAQYPSDFERDGVKVVALKKPTNRFTRILLLVPQCGYKAIKAKPDIIHYHDPELIPVGLLARLFGIHAIYDVHEDSVTSILDKKYLGWFRYPAAKLVGWIESIAIKFNSIIIAEKSYEGRFPSAVKVLNYPVQQATVRSEMGHVSCKRVLFVGVVGKVRGALQHANLVNLHPDIHVHIVGRISDSMRETIIAQAGENAERLHILGSDDLVPFEQITEIYSQGGWLAGLAIFPKSPDHYGKELTKFFEYMAAGIPILCSNFPVWKMLIEDQGCGICVDPDDYRSITYGLNRLVEQPALVEEMGKAGLRLAKKYSWGTQETNLIEMYDSILQC